MDCRNCGAPMRLVRDRDYFVCDYCGSYHFPEANRDGIRVLGEVSEILCPVCRTNLVTAALESLRVLHCPTCQGTLIAQVDFAFAVQYLRQARALLAPPLDRAELLRPLICPLCQRKMHTFHYGGGGNVVMDNCPACQVVWLDYGEIRRVLGLVETKDQPDVHIDD